MEQKMWQAKGSKKMIYKGEKPKNDIYEETLCQRYRLRVREWELLEVRSKRVENDRSEILRPGLSSAAGRVLERRQHHVS